MWALQLLCDTNFLELTIASPESREVQSIFLLVSSKSLLYIIPLYFWSFL